MRVRKYASTQQSLYNPSCARAHKQEQGNGAYLRTCVEADR